jgi:hypothetical protein
MESMQRALVERQEKVDRLEIDIRELKMQIELARSLTRDEGRW